LEFASKIAPLVREVVDAVKQSLGVELEFDIFLILDGQEVRFVMESV
jgi:predicted component of type VI protein secretion system